MITQSHTFWTHDMVLAKIVIDHLEKEIMFVSIKQGDPGIDLDTIFREEFKGPTTFQESLSRIENKIRPECPMNLDDIFTALSRSGKYFYMYRD